MHFDNSKLAHCKEFKASRHVTLRSWRRVCLSPQKSNNVKWTSCVLLYNITIIWNCPPKTRLRVIVCAHSSQMRGRPLWKSVLVDNFSERLHFMQEKLTPLPKPTALAYVLIVSPMLVPSRPGWRSKAECLYGGKFAKLVGWPYHHKKGSSNGSPI